MAATERAMPWVIGIDEAGYGPNLGPLVQAAVSVKLPEGDCAGWHTFRSVVRRTHEAADLRLLIDDSKKVYTQGGLAALEQGVRAALLFNDPTVGDLIRKTGVPGIHEELGGEAWYEAAERAPVTAEPEMILEALTKFHDEQPEGGGFGSAASIVVPTPHFNRICDANGTKAAVLSRGLIELIPNVLADIQQSSDSVVIHCDKHGGRHFYAAMIQEVFPDGWVVAEKESAEESRYRVELLDRPVTVVFRPRADGDSVAVALASMLCKYLREVCMRQFNRFWAMHVPGIKPTAGYPADARRFFEEIRPAMKKLGMAEDRVWRKK
jgi:ribonuclease HII